MSYENINSASPYFTIDNEGYYCTVNTTLNFIQKLTYTGNICSIFPTTSTVLSGTYGQLVDFCYDGRYYWTLTREGNLRYNYSSYGGYVYNYAIKKWELTSNLVLDKTFQINFNNSNSSDVIVPTMLNVDGYNTSFSYDVGVNSSLIIINNPFESETFTEGMVVLLGPNQYGQYENVTITGILSNVIYLDFYTQYAYSAGDPIYFAKNIHIFNKYTNTYVGNGSKGSWIKLDPTSGSIISRVESTNYKDVVAATVAYVEDIPNVAPGRFLLYVKNSQLAYVNLSTGTLSATMVIDNVQNNGSTIIPVYNICVKGDVIYRSQQKALYFGSDITWTNYNLVKSPIRSFIDSIATSAYPAILPCDNVSTSLVTTIIHDQYSNLTNAAYVTFSDDDSVGYLTFSEKYSDMYGEATSTYYSGVTPRTVTITTKATQLE